MKITIKSLGMVFLAIAMLFTMAACDDGGNGNGNGLGNDFTLTIDSVVNADASTNISFPYINFANGGTPSLLSTFSPGSEVKITNGKLTIKLGEVASSSLFSAEDMFTGQGITDSTVTASADLKIYTAGGFTDKVQDDYRLMCGTGENFEFAFLTYSNKDENLKGSFLDTTGDVDITFNLDLKLKKGWNYIITSIEDGEVKQITGTPPSNYKWTLYSGGNGDEEIQTSGTLTITGLGAYNGKRVVASGLGSGYNPNILAASSINNQGIATLGLISNGTVTLKVWYLQGEGPGSTLGSYGGNVSSGGKLQLMIFDSSTTTSPIGGNTAEPEENIDITVTFTNGAGTGSPAS